MRTSVLTTNLRKIGSGACGHQQRSPTSIYPSIMTGTVDLRGDLLSINFGLLTGLHGTWLARSGTPPLRSARSGADIRSSPVVDEKIFTFGAPGLFGAKPRSAGGLSLTVSRENRWEPHPSVELLYSNVDQMKICAKMMIDVAAVVAGSRNQWSKSPIVR